ncbi:glucokinase [Undibacterium cyanobacteriorum]|uniref:Glucokinase n=1 Tax=Undibacterium cyanobacteriorum TaxID=3073561 RepID=A0ABY9RL86_9BURK|nr:glucokinase [Undibacterium sp. 20NA77.5]WMW80786.1 glucokinase [Undibacterium sp. 20NA77.5]
MSNPIPTCAATILVADIGGTHARFALANIASENIHIHSVEKLLCHDFPTFPEVIAHYQTLHPEAVAAAKTAMVMAVAAPIIDGDVAAQANMPWPVRRAEIAQHFTQAQSKHSNQVHLLNDFVALAHAIPTLNESDLQNLCMPASGPRPLGKEAVLVMGPGTGLGAALWCPGLHEQASTVIASEAGHATWAPVTDREFAVAALLRQEFAHLDVERVLSGPGLMNLYRAICTLEQTMPSLSSPADVTNRAMQDHANQRNSCAVAALDMFCGILGSVMADLCINFGCQRALLAGGIPSQIVDYLRQSRLQERVLAKGVMRSVMEQVQVDVLDHGQLALLGAAQYYREQFLRTL